MRAPSPEVRVLSTGGARRPWAGRVVLALVLALALGALFLRAAWRRLEPRMRVTEALDAATRSWRWSSSSDGTTDRDGKRTGAPDDSRGLARPEDLLEGRDPWGRPWVAFPRDTFLRGQLEADRWSDVEGFYVYTRGDELAPLMASPERLPAPSGPRGAERSWLVYSRGPDGVDEGGLGDDLRAHRLGSAGYRAFERGPWLLGLAALLLACAWVVVRNLRAPRGTPAREALRAAVVLACTSPVVVPAAWAAGLVAQHHGKLRAEDLSPTLALSLPAVAVLSALSVVALVVVAIRARAKPVVECWAR